MSHLSIIIPYFSNTRTEAFEETLLSVLENRPKNAEIIVVSGEEYSDPWDVQNDGVRLLCFPDEDSHVRLLNNAVHEGKGRFLHILPPGAIAIDNWTEKPIQRFNDENVAVVIGAAVNREKPEQLISTGISWHCGGKIKLLDNAEPFVAPFAQLAPHVANTFFRKSALDEIQHFLPRFNPQIAYIDAALLLSELSWKIVQEPKSRVSVSVDNSDLSDYVWTRHSEQLFWRWLDWGGTGRSIVRHLGLVAAESAYFFFSPKRVQALLGRISGIGHFGAHRTRILEWQQIQQRIEELHIAKERETLFGADVIKFPEKTRLHKRLAGAA